MTIHNWRSRKTRLLSYLVQFLFRNRLRIFVFGTKYYSVQVCLNVSLESTRSERENSFWQKAKIRLYLDDNLKANITFHSLNVEGITLIFIWQILLGYFFQNSPKNAWFTIVDLYTIDNNQIWTILMILVHFTISIISAI